jgi:hypothetical protein
MQTEDKLENIPQILNPSELFVDEEMSEEEMNELLEDEADQSYEEGIDVALERATKRGEITKIDSESILSKREDTRAKLALIYVLMTFVIFIITFLVAIVDGLSRNVSIIDNLAKLIPIVSGVFLGTLGFVLGYYFKKGEE